MPMSFSIVSSDGSTPVENPKLAAYHYMARLQYQGRLTSLVSDNGRYSVASPGLETLIFYKSE
jgi:hypothetical protein